MKLQVKQLTSNELIITKSKFLTYLFPVTSLNEVKEKLNEFKEKYSDATHVCYSYILDENTFKYYDDGEPSSTAGAPIYQVLKNNNLVYTMCVVVRYFGGTKLGVGGLVKAYTNSSLECLNKSELVKYEQLDTYKILIDYSNYERLEYFIKNNNIEVTKKEFNEQVELNIIINKKNLELLQNSFQYYIKLVKLEESIKETGKNSY